MGKRTGDVNEPDLASDIDATQNLDVVEPADSTYVSGVMSARPYPDTLDTASTADVPGADYVDTGYGDTGTIAMEEEDSEIVAQREQIEQTRAEMSQTINELQDRLSPDNLTNQAKDAVKGATIGKAQQAVNNMTDTVQQAVNNVGDTASDYGGGFMEVVRENPIPLALAGLGLGWLFVNLRSRSSNSSGPAYRGRVREQGRYTPYGYGSGYSSPASRTPNYPYDSTYGEGEAVHRYQTPSYGGTNESGGQSSSGGVIDRAQGKVGDVAGQAQDTASTMVNQAQDTAGQVVGQVQDTAGQFANQAQQQASQLSDQAQWQVQRVQTQFDRTLNERPLAVSAAAFALGIAAGLAIPETQKEDELMGPARESLTERAQSMVQDTMQKVGTVAEEALGAAKDTAQQSVQEQGLAPGGDQGNAQAGAGQSTSSQTRTSGTSGSGQS